MRRAIAILAIVASALLPVSGQAAEVGDIRIAFEREKAHLFVREMITLIPDDKVSPKAEGVSIVLPKGAEQPQLADQTDSGAVQLRGNTIRVETVIPPTGLEIAVMFRLPIIDGVVAFDQSVNLPIAVAHAALMVPGDTGMIKGEGFSAARKSVTPDGINALFSVGRQFEDGRLTILLTGLSGGGRFARIIATALSFGMLLLGFIFWFRRKIAEKRSEE